MVDGTGTSKYAYDQLDRLTASEDGHGDVVGYEYDLANEQTKITYPSGKSVSRSYDKVGRLESVTDWLEHTSKFAYNADSEQTSTTFPASTGDVDSFAYQANDATEEVAMKKGSETLASIEYTRNKDAEATKVTTKGLPGEEKPAFSYDENSRLSKGAGIAYKYDAANDPTTIGADTYSYDAADELEKEALKTATVTTYGYDELGERTKTTPSTGAATTYEYDQAGNLISVVRPKAGETPAISDSYGYDGDGLRASQTISASPSYLAWDVADELPLILNDGTSSYVYGPGGLPIEQINNEGHDTYIHHDQQGSTRLLTGEKGEATGSYTYGAYGEMTGHTGSATTPLGYDGQYTSSDTGLIYLRARTYDPATAQFLSVDPLEAITGEPYGYVGENPPNLLDPSGLSACGSIFIVSTLCNKLEESGVSNVAAGALNVLTFGASTKLGGDIFGFNSDCASFGTGGEIGTVLGLGLGAFDGEDEAEVLAEGADEAVSVTSTARSTSGADGAESVVIKERAPDGETVLVVHQVGRPLPGGGTLIVHQHPLFGPLPGSQLVFPDVSR